jgi:3-oxoacyl-[acyl-carrier protein] reductase
MVSDRRLGVVTGGGQGIGRAVARTLAARGDAVVLVGRTPETLDTVVREIASSGGDATAVVADVRRGDDVRALFDHVRRTYGDADVLVTCAVQSRVARFLELTDEDWRGHFETKVLGAVRCMREVVPAMARQGWGRIVNLAGTTARAAGPGRMTNGMTNAAIANIGKHVADEFADRDVLVNTVHPGFTDTPRLDMIVERVAVRDGIAADEARDRLRAEIPTGRFVAAEEIADLVAYLCSENNRSITGQVVAVDGGMAGAVTY